MSALTDNQQLQIYTYYAGVGFQLGRAYLSPLPDRVRGKVDRQTSFNIYRNKKGNLRWKDYGGGGEFQGDAIDLISHMEVDIYFQDPKRHFKLAMKFYEEVIANSRLITTTTLQQQQHHHTTAAANKVNPIPYYDSEFTPSELNYFQGKPRYITPTHLKIRRVYGLRGIDWGNGIKSFPSTDSNPAFIFDLSEKGDMSSWKVYRPLTKVKRHKWLSWNLTAIPFEGYYLLPPTGDRLLFSSGYKDGMIAMNLGWITGNPTAEGSYVSILNYVSELNSRFGEIYILFDGDPAGIKAAKKLQELTGWKVLLLDYPILTGERLENAKKLKLNKYCKDLDDVVVNYDYGRLDYIINEKIY